MSLGIAVAAAPCLGEARLLHVPSRVRNLESGSQVGSFPDPPSPSNWPYREFSNSVRSAASFRAALLKDARAAKRSCYRES